MNEPQKLLAQAEALENVAQMVDDFGKACYRQTPPTGDICGDGARRLAVKIKEQASTLRVEARALAAQQPQGEGGEKRLWLWKNFVDGKPEYWAFDNPYPAQDGGDPITLGSPCGYAIFQASKNARPEIADETVLEEISRSKPVFTEEDFVQIIREADWRLWGKQLTEEDYKRAIRALNFPAPHSPPGDWQLVPTEDLDFEPDEKHSIADMANIGAALLFAIDRHRLGYCWNNSPAEIVGDLVEEIADLKEELNFAAPKAPAVGWISVEERLPEKNDTYLVCIQPVLGEKYAEVSSYEKPRHPAMNGWNVAKVTHWQPLPLPPKD